MSGLYVSKLTLSHFRSYQRAVIDCDARPIVFLGSNGSGKTNILEAVSLLSPGRGLRRSSAQDMAHRHETLGWKLTSVLHALDQVHEIEIWSEERSARQVRIDSKAAPQTALGRITRVLWLVPSMDRIWIEGAEGRRRFLDRMTLSFLPAHAEETIIYEKSMRERNRLLKDMVREPAWYGALELSMAQAGAAIHANRLEALAAISEAQSQAQTSFPKAALELVCDMPVTVSDFRAALAEGRPRDLAAGRTLIGPHRADLVGKYQAKGLPARDCSTGEQKALLVSLILANARALIAQFRIPPLLLLDEIAAHLDAGRQAALYEEICALGAQAWMTGTGPEMFASLGARAQVFEVTDEAGISRVERQ